MGSEGVQLRKYKILYISDFSMGGMDSAEVAIPRSGYANIGMELCRRLAAMGHQVIVLGLGYTGQEHWENFTIVPCNTLQDAAGTMANLKHEQIWGADVVIVALDIHFFQEQLFPAAKQVGIKYVCITPLEAEPLCITWANLLREMDKVFFISQFGADEAVKAGVEAEHVEIGIDTQAWRMRTPEEYKKVRETMGYDDDEFVVMTVADNQERKNLGAGMQIVADLKLHGIKSKYILVTREASSVGWKLYDLAYNLGISSDVRVFNNGIPFHELFTLYCAADVFLLPSKAEGLGLPVMEAMSIGVPVVATKTGALPELLSEDRGWLVNPAFKYIDPFGNQNRYFIDVSSASGCLMEVKDGDFVEERITAARKFMESKDWQRSAQQIEDALNKLFEDENGRPESTEV